MSHFIKNGNTFRVAPDEAIDVRDTLPVGTYTVKQNPMTGEYFLETVEDFNISGKIYGDASRNADRVINTFQERPGSTGVMLSGEKGSGKTLLAKMISTRLADTGVPTIVINQPHVGEEFNSFIQTIQQAAVIIFDEFEKVYDSEDQEKLLTLLDGVYVSKKLFIITCNDKWRVNEHMRNRPGRLYYRFDYTGIDMDFIKEYCDDNLDNKSHIDALTRLSVIFGAFNFDMLKAMVEEMNRYDESPQEVMAVLNAKPELDNAFPYDVALTVNGVEIPTEKLSESRWSGNPITNPFSGYYYTQKLDSEGDEEYERVRFSPDQLGEINSTTGTFVFTNEKQQVLTLTRVQTKTFDYSAY